MRTFQESMEALAGLAEKWAIEAEKTAEVMNDPHAKGYDEGRGSSFKLMAEFIRKDLQSEYKK